MHHTAGLKAALREEGRGREAAVLRGRSVDPEVCSPRERAVIDFAVKLTKGTGSHELIFAMQWFDEM